MKPENKIYLLAAIMFVFGVIFCYTPQDYNAIPFFILCPLFAIIAYFVGAKSDL